MSVRRLVWLDLVTQRAYRSLGQRPRELNSRKVAMLTICYVEYPVSPRRSMALRRKDSA